MIYSEKIKPTLSLGEALTSVFKNYAIFTGRARRSEYWWYVLVYSLINLLLEFVNIILLVQIMSGEISRTDPLYLCVMPMAVIVALGLIIPSLSVTVRRLHDIGKSGWNILWSIIPIIGAILLLVWTCQDSDVVANRYGKSPKYSM